MSQLSLPIVHQDVRLPNISVRKDSIFIWGFPSDDELTDLGGILISVIPSYSVLFQARLMSVHSCRKDEVDFKLLYFVLNCPASDSQIDICGQLRALGEYQVPYWWTSNSYKMGYFLLKYVLTSPSVLWHIPRSLDSRTGFLGTKFRLLPWNIYIIFPFFWVTEWLSQTVTYD